MIQVGADLEFVTTDTYTQAVMPVKHAQAKSRSGFWPTFPWQVRCPCSDQQRGPETGFAEIVA
jgi:hypothetical protein